MGFPYLCKHLPYGTHLTIPWMAPSTQSKAPFALGVAQPSSNPPLAVVAMDKRRGFKGRAIDMASLEESSAIQEAGSNGLYLHLNV